MKNLPPNYYRNESRKTLRCHPVIFVLILLISSQIQALHIQNYKNEWNLHDFTEESGLAASNVFQIDFDSDNNAWLATSNGLVKFNGFDWITYTMKDGLPSNFVRSVHAVGSKSLWIGTDSGAVLFTNGNFSKNGSDTGLFGKNVRRIYKDRENTIWFCSDSWPSKKDFGGLTYLKNGKWVSVKSFEDEYVVNIFQDSKGKFFVITKNGVFIKEDDEWQKQLITNEPVNWTSSSVIEVNDMGVLVSTGENLFVFNNNRWETLKNIPYHSYGIANFGNSSFVILNTSRNDFKVFSIYKHRQFVPQTVEHRSIRGYIENLTADKKGNIWAVGYGSVLMWNVGQPEWVEYLEICEVLFPFQNGIIINELNNVIKFEPDGERTELFSISANARSINNANAVWDGKNIYLFESDRIKKITIPSHIEFNSIKNIAATEDYLWLLLDNNDRTNLARFNFTNWSIVNIPAGFEVNNISTNIDKKYLWLDMLNSSRDRRFISILHGDKFSTVTESEINYTEIKSDGFFIDSKHNTWIYNENEIINYNKQHNKWNRIKGLLGRSITQIHELGNYLWLVNASLLGGKDGISRISLIDGTISNFPTDIITCSFLDQHDKLIFGSVDKFFIVDSITHYQPFKINLPTKGNIRSLIKSAEGKYFIAYENGLLLYQPQNIDARIELIDIPEETIVHTELFLNIKSIRKFTSSRYSNNFRYSLKINDGQWSHYFDQSQFAIKTDTLLIGENSIQLKYQDLPFNPIKEAEPIIITVHDIPLHKKPFFIPIVLMILLIMTFLAITAFRSESRLKKLVGLKTVELTATTQKYKDLFESANDAILIFEPHSEVILEANNKACEVYGFTKNELIGMSFKKITFDVKKGEDAIGKILSGESFRNFETKHYTKDGNVLDFLVNASLIEYNGKLSILTINHEITEIKKTEYEIKRLNRVYALLSNTNEAIVRTHDRQKLLNEICQIAVKEGKFKLAWIGMLNDSNTIEVTSSAQIFESKPGEKEINVSNIMQCQCLSESVMKSGNYIFVNDLENDKRVFSCKGDVLSMGCKSSASFPVKIFGKVYGTFNLFSDEIDFFHKEEIKLLDEMSMDISFALEYIQTEDERKRAEDELKSSEEQFRLLFENSPVGIGVADQNGNILAYNDAILKQGNYTREDIKKVINVSEIYYKPEQKEEVGTIFKVQGFVKNHHVLLKRKDGSPYNALISLTKTKFKGQPCIQAIVEDITERVEAEITLRENEAFTRTVMDNLPIGIAVNTVEPGVKFEYINDNFVKFYRTTKEALENEDEFWNAVYEDTEFRESIRKRVLEDCSSGNPDLMFWEDVPITRKNEETRFITARNIPLPGKKLMISTVWDVTERKRSEDMIRESELKLRNIFEHSTNVFYSHDVNHVIQFISPQIERLLGHPVELAKRKWTEFLSDNPINEIGLQKTVAAIETGIAQDPYKLELIHKNGNKVLVEVREAPVVEGGRTVAIVGSLTDITARKKAEDALESERILLKTIIDNIPDAIYTKDLQFRKTLVNKADLINMGVEGESEVLGKTDFDFFPKDDAEKFIEIDKQIIGEGKTILNVEESFADVGGNIHWLLTSKLPLRNNKGEIEGLLGIGRDITIRKKAEDELKKRLKFEKEISSASSDFININQDAFNKTINATLAKIGSIAGVDRSYLFMFSHDMQYCSNTHEWCRDGIEPQIDNLQQVPVTAVPWWMDKLNRFETIHIPNVSDLQEEAAAEKEILEAQEIKSLIVVPLVSLNKLLGFIGFDSVVEQKIWAEEDILLLKMLGEIIVNAINKINAESALRENEEKLRTLFNTSIEGICLTNENDKIILVNPRMEEMMGYSRGQMINKDFKILIPGNELDDYLAKNEMRKKGKSEIYEWKLKTKYGTHLWVMISASPVLDEQGKYKGSFGMFTDITELKIAEEEVRKLYRGVEQSPASVLITDISGNLEYVNKTFCDVTGYSYSEVIGKNPRFLNSGEKPKEFYAGLWNSILSGKDWHGEFHNKKKNGELFWESASISPITDDQGEITHFIAIKEDITERKLVQENLRMSEQQFRSIWENSFDGMRLTDQNGIIVEVNNAFCNLVNKDKSELIGENFILPYADKDVRAIKKYKENFRSGNIKPKLETKVQLWNGEEKWISLSNSFVRLEKETILVLSIFRDITDQKNYENNLMTAKVKAESSEKLKTEFLAQMSHEIRTPLNALMSYTTLLHDELKADKSEEFEELFNGISNSGSRIIRTIDLILNASELQTGGYYAIKKSVDIFNDVVVKVHNDFERFAKSKELEFRIKNFTENSYAICDEYSVYQSIVNLVDNAIKYTEKGSVELILKRNKSNQMQIEIEDTGIGISEEYLEHLFEPFTQEETGYSRKFEGIGLGLSLVKKYCEINNIQIDVESKKNVGTKFTLIFPG